MVRANTFCVGPYLKAAIFERVTKIVRGLRREFDVTTKKVDSSMKTLISITLALFAIAAHADAELHDLALQFSKQNSSLKVVGRCSGARYTAPF